MRKQELIQAALEAMEKAYAPYSKFSVGAAILTAKGNIYKGCNIENASYGLTNCAERTAIFKAVSEGEREVVAVSVAGATEEPISPCGACRQVLVEFCKPETPVYLTNVKGDVLETTVAGLLPYAFKL
ncbi:cytidine deaminase [Desulfuribacillus stibiiarsenatis]|uniref:Cytidine deaminase n=1 Tax=Desulfuribacillus stibiiarsenatis TaxID=1390249 RepID=A0A1E5L7Q1_9FIRM|nr:cytidine deaminase [Desulfuribacillus stibiiarsenatis]OEH86161.1 cytidine deaminase [Desulfuribacillus stibiiarsenatis]